MMNKDECKKVILDTDIGTDCDDALALALCLKSPQIDLVGVTCVYGDVRTRAKIAHKLASLAEGETTKIPIYEGVSNPVLGEKDIYWAGHEGKGLVEDCSSYSPSGINAVDFIIDTIMKNKGDIILIPIGPLSNIAAALIKEPNIAKYVKEVIIMGGAACPGKCIQLPDGNDIYVPYTEHNFAMDPEAARIVFNANMPITMVGLDVTLQTCIEDKHIERIKSLDTPFTDAIAQQVQTYMEDVCRRRWTWLHDPLAVGYCVNPDFLKVEKANVQIVTYPDIIAGQAVVTYGEGGNVKVCREVKSSEFVDYYVSNFM